MKKSGLEDTDYLNAIEELAKGLHDGELGGKLYKKRVQAPGQGKRGGYRVIIATKKKERWFFLYGFKKGQKDTLTPIEHTALKTLASDLLSMTEEELKTLLEAKEYREL